MHGIVSLLDEQHYAAVEELWRELEKYFGQGGLYKTPFPHFSYHVAPHYDVERLAPLLERHAAGSKPFRVLTTELAVFPGDHPVLHVRILPSLELKQYQQRLCEALADAGVEGLDLYHPEKWVPHITLADGERVAPVLPDMVHLLNRRVLTWEIEVENLALIYDNGGAQEVRLRYPFG